MTVQDVSSNLVYIVGLGKEIEETGMSFRDVVIDHEPRRFAEARDKTKLILTKAGI